MNHAGDREDPEFWLKPPTYFTQSTYKPNKIIMAAGSRSNYIFDLKLDHGVFQLYSEADKKLGKCFRWQTVPFAHKLDMIDKEHVSIIVHKKEAKWLKTAQCELKDLD